MRLKISKYYQSWKDSTNNKVTIVPKNIKNDIPTNIMNYTPWNEDCAIKKYKFNANPIKHYRKQYTNINSSSSTFSKLSLIGLMDKPGGTINSQINENDCTSLANNSNLNILTYFDINNNCKTAIGDKFYDPVTNKMQCTSLSTEALVIKRATTVLSDDYSSSAREYLYKKCKTFNQNLPLQQREGTKTKVCNNLTTCVTFNPSNKTFQTQGPVSSSARTHSLKYGCIDGLPCNKRATINNCPSTMSLEECATLKKLLNNPSAICVGCINDPDTIRRKRINILK
jgi:hypothetical protein